MVEDRSLLEVILPDITKENIRNLYIKAINEDKGKRDFKYEHPTKKGEGGLYEKPSEEQLRKARQLYN